MRTFVLWNPKANLSARFHLFFPATDVNGDLQPQADIIPFLFSILYLVYYILHRPDTDCASHIETVDCPTHARHHPAVHVPESTGVYERMSGMGIADIPHDPRATGTSAVETVAETGRTRANCVVTIELPRTGFVTKTASTAHAQWMERHVVTWRSSIFGPFSRL